MTNIKLISQLPKGHNTIGQGSLNTVAPQLVELSNSNNYQISLASAISSGHQEQVFKLVQAKGILDKASLLDEALRKAIILGNTDAVSIILSADAIDINEKDKYGNTLLHLAVQRNKPAIVELLLAYEDIEVDVNIKNNAGSTALHLASAKNLAKIIELLLCSPNIEVNERDNSGYTALYLAIIGGYEPAVRELLLCNKIDVNIPAFEVPPLYTAIALKHGAIAKRLLSIENIDVNAQDENGLTAMHMAVINNNLFGANLIINHFAADLNMKDKNGFTPMHIAAIQGTNPFITLLAYHPKIDLSITNHIGATSLHLATANNNIEAARILSNISNINAQDINGWTPLHVAAACGNVEIIRLLLSTPNIDCLLTNIYYYNALHLAVIYNHLEATIELANVIDVNFQDICFGYNALYLAVRGGNPYIVQALLSYDNIIPILPNIFGMTALELAIENDNVLITEILLEKISDCYHLSQCLITATENGNLQIVELLLKKPTIDVNLTNFHGQTALHIATEINHTNIIKLLLEHDDIDANLKDIEGVSPLHEAILSESTDALEELLKSGKILVNTQDKEGNTALHLASKYEFLEGVKLLLKHPKIDISLYNNEGLTPMMLTDNIVVINLIIDYVIEKAIIAEDSNENYYQETYADSLNKEREFSIDEYFGSKLVGDKNSEDSEIG